MATQARRRSPDLAAIKLLGAMCFDRNKTLIQQADKALYQKIIIPLCDDFTSQGAHVSSLILATLIQQAANNLDAESRRALDQAGLLGAEDLLARMNRIQASVSIPSWQQKRIKKICILSRVTIGADISITSVIIQRLHQHFPKVPITLIGPEHLPQLFDQPFLNHRFFEFKRNQRNSSRLNHWVELQQIIAEEQSHLDDDEFLLVDPDSRLSQLGILPLAPEKSTRILPSRKDQNTMASLPQITNAWLDAVLNAPASVHPAIAIQEHGGASPAHSKFTIAINFGVGNDQSKRVSLQFEKELILTLIRQGNTRVILDSGKGSQETVQAKAIENFILKAGIAEDYPDSFLRIQDSIDTLARHIQNADLFIGYDSCSGHIATACNIPTIICFKGAPNPRFYARWQPQNRFGVTSCLEVPQKQLNEKERSLLIQRIIDIASSYNHTCQ